MKKLFISQPMRDKTDEEIKAERAKALYTNDANKKFRKSHENPFVKEVYAEYLGEPNSHKAHEILHTTYVDRSKDVIM